MAEATVWPLTGWRLFSTVRGPVQNGWDASVVGSHGAERPLPVDRLGRGFRGTLHVLNRFPSMTEDERSDVCRAWLEAVRAIGDDASAVLVYRTKTTVSMGGSPPTTTQQREVVYRC